jgi:hypothetical protein
MSKTKIDLVNSALILVGDTPITSLDDQSTQALVANTILEDVIEAELFETRWRFATETTTTSFVVSVTHPTGLGVFQIPVGTVRIWNVLERGRSINGEWEMEGDKLLINADANSVISIERTVEPPVATWPPHFRMSIIHALAAMFCMGLTENEEKAKLLASIGDTYKRKARSQDGGQSTPRAITTQQFLAARRGLRSGNEGLL